MQGYNNQKSDVSNKTNRHKEQGENPQTDRHLDFLMILKSFSGERIAFPTNGTGKLGTHMHELINPNP